MTRSIAGLRGRLIFWFSVFGALYHLYYLFFGLYVPQKLNAAHLLFILPLAFVLYKSHPSQDDSRVPWWDTLLALLGMVVNGYIVVYADSIASRTDPPQPHEMLLGLVTMLLVLEAARRTTGWVLPAIGVVFLLYLFGGQYLPGDLAHAGFSLNRIISTQYLTTTGLYGSPIRAAATMIVMFTIFGSFLTVGGAGPIIMDLAYSLAGRYTGGPAKIAVIASAGFGTVSGSAVANVVTTGQFTIPLMKRVGYRPSFAGAVEAAASTGGVLMPPIMGAGAFVMADILGVSYFAVAKAAIIPALIYYLGVFVMVHLEATRTGMRGLPASELPRFWPVTRNSWHVLLPIGVLVYAIFAYVPLGRAAFYALMTLIVTSAVQAKTRLNFTKITEALDDGFTGVIGVSAACATAGIVVGVINLTGLGLKFGALLTKIAAGNMLMALIVTAITLLIMGMGLPATAAYIIGAAVAGPALTDLGITPMAAHMFIFYYSCISAVTPPVALAAYAGASIAKASPYETGMEATKLVLAGFLIPFMFVMDTALLWEGPMPWILWASATAIIGVWILCVAVIGYLWHPMPWYLRTLGLVAGVTLMVPERLTDFAGFVGIAVVVGIQFINGYRQRSTVKAAGPSPQQASR